jgi:hypothetical protein
VTVDRDVVMQLAAIGSRQSGFNHDIASKMQGIMMALDELGELIEPLGDEDLQRAASTAVLALRELNQLLTASRALTKPQVKARVLLHELVVKGCERSGVSVRVALPDAACELGMPLALQGLALAIDVAAGTGRNRELAPRLELATDHALLILPRAPTANTNAETMLEIATWIFGRDGVELQRSDDRLALRFALAR